ncbi:MAG: phospho-N-acetylmuramoyl-pentapeptide-transferase [Bacteroidales bacterium]|nr:phospho-N-acetylmuramoyl-pentapeptide-transferase [Bacteroidales bacterium]MCB9012992.1 phospho-N-acetylmuramoyl-pentapeptide-transferase [Bacteroidales bacterium]
MLYYLFQYLDKLDVPGAGVFQYISFRSAMAIITSLAISTIYGKRIISILQRKQIGETIRDLGLEGQMQKKGTPTMGGLIILLSIIVPTLLFGDLKNIYVILMLVTTVWLGFIGFLDDYIKVFRKNKKGLAGKFKVIGQIVLGLIVGMTLYFSNQVVIRKHVEIPVEKIASATHPVIQKDGKAFEVIEKKSNLTTIPFLKNNEFDYSWLVWFMGDKAVKYAWIVFVLITIFILTAVSNGANMTDGLDGLATGVAAIIGTTLGILAYVSGNTIIAEYLKIMYIPHIGELVIFASAFIGATVGFLWYNSYPAQIFMGDTGSLAIGGIIAVFAIIIRKELLIPILCGVFLVENLSVVMQVSWFKYTKRKFGEGRRIFRMAPLHHHFQLKGYPEAKIVTRFWIIGILLAVITIITLKIR